MRVEWTFKSGTKILGDSWIVAWLFPCFLEGTLLKYLDTRFRKEGDEELSNKRTRSLNKRTKGKCSCHVGGGMKGTRMISHDIFSF